MRTISFDRNPNVGGIPARDKINIMVKMFSLFIYIFCSVNEYVKKVDFIENVINIGRIIIV